MTVPDPVTGHRPYECADGWIALTALEPKFWQALCRGLGRKDLFERHMDVAVAGELEVIFATRAPENVVAIDQPGATAPVRLLGPPVRMSRSAPDGTRPGLALGADTDTVLTALGYGPEEIGRLRADGAIA